MTTLFSYDFEAGVASGTAMTAGNSAFKNFVSASGWTFSNAHLLSQGGGALAGRCAPVGAICIANNNATPWASTNTLYYRFYAYVEKVPTTTATVLPLWAGPTPGPSTTASDLRITSSGAAQIRNNASTQVAISPNLLTVGTYARVEGFLNVGTNQQQLKLFINANVHGNVADYDSGLLTSAAGGVGITSFNFGFTTATTGTVHFDNLAFSNSGWLGPVVVANQPPTANAGTDQTGVEPWSTVTLTGTDSDPDGTIASRGWTQTGGTPVTYTVINANTVTFTAPVTTNGDSGSHKYTVTDNLGASANDTVNVTTLPVTERAVLNGVEVPARLFHVHTTTAINPPTAPRNVVATLTTSTSPYSVTLTWTAPASNGGSAITGYTVTRRGNGSHTLASTATSDTWTGLTAAPPYTFDVYAVNAAGTSPAGTANTAAASTSYRFPGDTLPLVTGKYLIGCDERDNNGMAVKPDWEFKAPEADTGVRYGATKYFYDGSYSNLVPGTGQMFQDWATATSRGNIILASMAIQQNGDTWAQSATSMAPGGANYSKFYNFIAGIEESTTTNSPFWFVLVHEPQSKTNTTTGSGMTSFDYADMQKGLRAIMDDYATAKAGSPSAYKWKRFSFGGLQTGESFSTNPSGGNGWKYIDNYFTGTDGNPLPARTWDWAGSDCYQGPISGTTLIGRTGVPQWNSGIQSTIAWCAGKGIPTVIGEYGIHNTDADAATQLQTFWDNITDGTHDVVAALYWNSAPNGPISTGGNDVGRFLLTDYYMNNPPGSGGSPAGSNGGLYTVFKSMMTSTKVVNFWNDPRYPKPPGL